MTVEKEGAAAIGEQFGAFWQTRTPSSCCVEGTGPTLVSLSKCPARCSPFHCTPPNHSLSPQATAATLARQADPVSWREFLREQLLGKTRGCKSLDGIFANLMCGPL